MSVHAWIVPWYRQQDWADWRALFKFEGTHKEWLSRAEAGVKTQEALGFTVARVIIEPRKFLDWSRARGGKADGNARMSYAISLFKSREHCCSPLE